MIDPPDPHDRWTFEGRHFLVTSFSDVATRDGYGFELVEVVPTAGEPVLEAFWDDTTGKFTFTAFTDQPLPFRLIEQFVTVASASVPPPQM